MTANIDFKLSYDPSGIVGYSMPNVFIKKITLETINQSKKNVNTQANSDSQLLNDVSKPYLKTSLDVTIKDYYNGKDYKWSRSLSKKNNLAGLSKGKGIFIYIVQTTTQAAANVWSSVRSYNDIKWQKGSEKEKQAMTGTEIIKYALSEFISVEDQSDFKKMQPEIDDKEQRVYNFTKNISFPSDRKLEMNSSRVALSEEQSNLAYFAFSLVEPPKNIKNANVLKNIMGKMCSDIVFSNGKIPRQSYVYTLKNSNEIWGGPVHYHNGDVMVDGRPYTGFMGGKSHHTGQKQPLLDKVSTMNNKILDYRDIQKLQKTPLSFAETEFDIKAKTFPGKNIDSQIFRQIPKKSYFSEMYISYDANKNVKFSFSFDIKKYLRDNTAYSKVFASGDANSDAALGYINIKSIKVIRKRKSISESKMPKNQSKKFSPIESKGLKVQTFQETLGDINIRQVRSSENLSKDVKKRYSYNELDNIIICAYQNGTEIANSISSGDGVSSIRFMSNPFVENDSDFSGIYMFTGIDKSFSNVSQADYNYEIQMVIENKLNDMLSEQISILQNDLSTLNTVISVVDKKGKNSLNAKKTSKSSFDSISKISESNVSFYDPKNDTFTSEFIKQISSGQILKEIEPNYWANIPLNFSKAENILADHTSLRVSDLTNMKNYLNPIGSSINEYYDVVKMLETLIKKYQTYLEINNGTKNPKSNVGPQTKKSVKNLGKSKPQSETYLSHKFSQKINSSMQKNKGSLFFNMTDEEIFSDTENALRLFSYEDFGNIVKYEKQKLYNPNENVVTLESYPASDFSLRRNEYSYFTPSALLNGQNKIVRIENAEVPESDLDDVEINFLRNKMSLSPLSYNKSPTTNTTPPLDIDLSEKIASMFSYSDNVTVVDNMPKSDPFIKTGEPSKDIKSQDISVEEKKYEFDNTSQISSNQKAYSLFRKISVSSGPGNTFVSGTRPSLADFTTTTLKSNKSITDGFISELPNQIKAIIISQDSSESSNFGPNSYLNRQAEDLLSLDDPFQDSSVILKAKNLFQNICTLEVLTGYGTVKYGDKTERDVTSPIWSVLNQSILRDAQEDNKYLLCRIVPYSNSEIGIQYDEENSPPILEQYFMIGGSSTNDMPSKLSQETVADRLTATFNNPMYQTTNAKMFSSDSNTMNVPTEGQQIRNVERQITNNPPQGEDTYRRASTDQQNFYTRTGAPAQAQPNISTGQRSLPSMSRGSGGGGNTGFSGGGY